MPRATPPELRERIEAMMRTPHYMLPEIAKATGAPHSTVQKIAQRLGYRAPEERLREAYSRGARRLNEDAAESGRTIKSLIVACLRENPQQTSIEVAAKCGCSAHLVRRYAAAERLPYLKTEPTTPRVRRPAPTGSTYGPLTGAVLGRMMESKPGHGHRDPERQRSFDNGLRHAQRVAVLPPLTEDEARRLIERHIAERGVTRCPSPQIEAPTNLGVGWGSARP